MSEETKNRIVAEIIDRIHYNAWCGDIAAHVTDYCGSMEIDQSEIYGRVMDAVDVVV